MTDDERAKHVWNRVCEAAEYAKNAGITGTALYALMGNTCLKETEAAFAAIREECATVARDMARQVAMGQRDHATGFDISDAILRPAQPAGRAQEGA
jgi:hypothetical protein